MNNKEDKLNLYELMESETNPVPCDGLMQRLDFYNKEVTKLKKEIGFPEFNNEEEYFKWLETPEGKDYIRKIEALHQKTNDKFNK